MSGETAEAPPRVRNAARRRRRSRRARSLGSPRQCTSAAAVQRGSSAEILPDSAHFITVHAEICLADASSDYGKLQEVSGQTATQSSSAFFFSTCALFSPLASLTVTHRQARSDTHSVRGGHLSTHYYMLLYFDRDATLVSFARVWEF